MQCPHCGGRPHFRGVHKVGFHCTCVFAVSTKGMYGEQSMSWLVRFCSCEVLEPPVTLQEELTDVCFISVSYSVRFVSLKL